MSVQERLVEEKKGRKEAPKTSGEMTKTEKRTRIAQKKRLGQPAGRPRRVKSLKRRKKTQENYNDEEKRL